MSRHLHASGAVVSYAPGCVDAAGIELLELPNLMPSSGQASTCMIAAAPALGLAAPAEAARPKNKVDVVSQQADCSHAEHAGVYLQSGPLTAASLCLQLGPLVAVSLCLYRLPLHAKACLQEGVLPHGSGAARPPCQLDACLAMEWQQLKCALSTCTTLSLRWPSLLEKVGHQRLQWCLNVR